MIAIITFLGYRSGRLWSFYYRVIDTAKKQIKIDPLDLTTWENIAEENCEKLISDLFRSVFRFEIEYLRWKIIDNKDMLWVSDKSSTRTQEVDEENIVTWSEESRSICDKAKFCEHSISKLLESDFRLFGIGLFFKSLWHSIVYKKDKDYVKTTKEGGNG